MAGNKLRSRGAAQCKCASDKQSKKFIHSEELQPDGRKINTNLMNGCKTNSTVELSAQNTGRGEERGGERMRGEEGRPKHRENSDNLVVSTEQHLQSCPPLCFLQYLHVFVAPPHVSPAVTGQWRLSHLNDIKSEETIVQTEVTTKPQIGIRFRSSYKVVWVDSGTK